MLKFSIIIPVFNTSKWLPVCLDSILSQTERSLELICIDDCSTDDSVSVIKRYMAVDKRVRLIRLETRVSTGAVRNEGLRAALGKYVAFMDSDDLYPNPDTLNRLAHAIESSGCSLAVGYVVCFAKDDMTTAKFDDPSIGYAGRKGVVSYQEWQDVRGFCACLYDRNFLTGNHLFFPPITRNEDPVFFMNVLLAAKKFVAVDECTYLYRIGYKTIDWAAGNFRLKKEHVQGLLDMLKLAVANGLDKLEAQLAKELAGSIDSFECFNALGRIGDDTINAICRCRHLRVVDKEFVYHWIVRNQSKITRLYFVLCKFGVMNVLVSMIGFYMKRILVWLNHKGAWS